jgi:protein-disulfide isomerase
MANKKFDSSYILPIALLVLLIGGIAFLLSSDSNTTPQNTTNWSTGNLESDTELVVFSDLECPACASAHTVSKELEEKYRDYVKFTFRHFPLRQIHTDAAYFAEAAEAAGVQGEFFLFIDLIYSNHTEIFGSDEPRDKMKEFVRNQTTLNFEQFESDLDSGKFRADVRFDESEAKKLGLQGTPTYILNGEILELNSFSDLDGILADAIGVDISEIVEEVPTEVIEEELILE